MDQTAALWDGISLTLMSGQSDWENGLMTVDLLKQLDNLKGCWMMGGSALEKSLPSWRQAVQDDAFPDLALVALAGQAMQFALQPRAWRRSAIGTRFAAVAIADAAISRASADRTTGSCRQVSEPAMSGLLRLLAARGLCRAST